MADSLLVGAGGIFGGNATISGNVTNNGRLSPGNSPGTINILGNYVAGVGAIFDMEVQFANAGAPVNGVTHDRVNITGSATGTTLLNVIPFLPSSPAAPTAGNGVELVRVAGAVGSGNQFQLAAPVVQDAYEYILTYRANFSGTDDGWFLTSRAGENLYGEAAMFSTGQAVIDSCFRGEDAMAFDGNGHKGRGWARVKTGGIDTGADTGLQTEMEYNCGSGGADVRIADSVRLGVAAGYASTDTNVFTPTGIADMNGDAMMGQVYMSMHHGNFFANLSAGYAAMDFQFDGAVSDMREGDVSGAIGGLQLGANWSVWDAWHLGAIGEVNYDGLDCDDGCLVAGTIADTSDWSARATLRLDGRLHDGQFLPYFALSLSDRFGELTVTNGTASLTSDTASSLLGAKVGATVMIDNGWALFVNGGITEGIDNDVSGWDGTGGLKVIW
ncbi:MAG: autotransporter domain-containing protein, partial [Micropepsaceae bacterium]